jgi:hypothetical protein
MAKSSGNTSENIQHIVFVRYRITGSGNLKTTVESYKSIQFSNLANIAMSSDTDREPGVLANFNAQRMRIRFETDEFDETFTLTRIISFVKPVATGYPQGI